jgi:DNA-binding response OmpR family regulator
MTTQSAFEEMPYPPVPDQMAAVIPLPTVEAPLHQDILPTSLAAGRILVDHLGFSMKVDGNCVDIRLTELKVLEILITNRHRYLSLDELNLGMYGVEIHSNAPSVYLGNVRRKMGDELSRIIKTKHGAGYRIDDTEFLDQQL